MKTTAPRRRPPSSRRPAEFFYPESDGEPMGETDDHRDVMLYLIEALKLWFQGAKAYVSGDLMLYWVEGDARLTVSPDVFVVKGVEQRRRRVYKVWEEGRAPDVVIEVSSRSTRLQDLRWKRETYRDVLRVREYYVFDPFREYLEGGLLAWTLRRGQYVARPVRNGRIRSRELGLELIVDGPMLRLRDPKSGRVLPDVAQAEEERRREQAARQQEVAARRRAERQVERLRALVERLRRPK